MPSVHESSARVSLTQGMAWHGMRGETTHQTRKVGVITIAVSDAVDARKALEGYTRDDAVCGRRARFEGAIEHERVDGGYARAHANRVRVWGGVCVPGGVEG